jgi:hypothetical protein
MIWNNLNFESFRKYLKKRLCNVFYNRAGIAYDSYGNTVSDNTGLFKNGLLIEDSTTNLLTANQSNGCEDGTTSGWYAPATGSGLSSDSSTFFQGSSSLRVTTSGVVSGQGAANIPSAPVTPNSTCTASFWIKGEAGVSLNVCLAGRTIDDLWVTANYVYPVMTGDWQYVEVSHVMGPTEVNGRLYVQTPTAMITVFNIDMVQIEQKAYATSWTLGGTTRNAPSYYIHSANFLNIDTNGSRNLLTVSASKCETGSDWGVLATGPCTKTVDNTVYYEGSGSIKLVTGGVSVAEGVGSNGYTVVTPSITYTASCMVKGVANATLGLQLIERDSGGNALNTFSYNFTATGNWQYVYVTGTFTSNGVNASLKVLTTTTAQATTIYFDQAQIEPNSAPTDWMMGGTQRNSGQGTIECNCCIPDLPNNVTFALFGHTTSFSSGNPDCIRITSDGVNGNLLARVADSRGSVSGPSVPISSIGVGYHDIAVSWDSTEITLYVDGVPVGSTTNPSLPQSIGIFYIGMVLGSWKLNSYIQTIVISNIKRTADDILARAQAPNYTIDDNVTAFLPLQSNTNAYVIGD